jgi:hypothetical protein
MEQSHQSLEAITITNKRQFKELLNRVDQGEPDLLKALMVYLKPRLVPGTIQPPPPVPPDLELDQTAVSVYFVQFLTSQCFISLSLPPSLLTDFAGCLCDL